MQIAGSIFRITPSPFVILNFSTSLSFDFTLRNDTFFTGGGRLLSTQNSRQSQIADSVLDPMLLLGGSICRGVKFALPLAVESPSNVQT